MEAALPAALAYLNRPMFPGSSTLDQLKKIVAATGFVDQDAKDCNIDLQKAATFVNDLKKVANGKAKEIGKSIEQVQKDATGEMTALSKQVMKDLRDDTKSLDEMESNTQLHASDIEEWKRKVESALSKTEEHLGDVDRKLRDEMTDATDRFDVRKGKINISWFDGGKTNICYNALDRHVQEGRGDKVAFDQPPQPTPF